MAKKKQSSKKMWISLFIVAIMILSAFGFMLSYQTSETGGTEEYNGHKLVQTQKGLMIKIDGKESYFNYYPASLETLNFSDSIKSELANTKALWVTYDPDSDFAATIAEKQLDMEQKLFDTKEIYIARGLANATGYALPEITCKNATEPMPVLYLKKGNKTTIESAENCITLTAATEQELNLYHAKIMYLILGVMK